jgi:hypothetical protein
MEALLSAQLTVAGGNVCISATPHTAAAATAPANTTRTCWTCYNCMLCKVLCRTSHAATSACPSYCCAAACAGAHNWIYALEAPTTALCSVCRTSPASIKRCCLCQFTHACLFFKLLRPQMHITKSIYLLEAPAAARRSMHCAELGMPASNAAVAQCAVASINLRLPVF